MFIGPLLKISIHALTRRAALCQDGALVWRNISIHALTRRAAYRQQYAGIDRYISIHALTRRAADDAIQAAIRRHHFNPRSHEESGASSSDKFLQAIRISIHALTRRAAHESFDTPLSSLYFNPRSHEESGINNIIDAIPAATFQSTLSRGERLLCVTLCSA